MFPALMLALHLVGVVLWIGGVGMATMVVLPAARDLRPAAEGLRFFQIVEHRFAPLARWLVILVGVTGLVMLWQLNLWDGFRFASFWWLHAMALVWLIFAALLFVIEPRHARRRIAPEDDPAITRSLRGLQFVHGVLLALSLLTIAGAVVGARGITLFG